MFSWINKKLKTESRAKNHEESLSTAADSLVDINDQYLSDQPITQQAQDRFRRAPFASRIADTISKRSDSSSIVIGLFAPWGDGKTSVLEMMEERLKLNSRVVVVRFNPWHFQSEELLLRGFFATLADGLGKSLPNLKEKAGEMFKKYGALLSVGSLTLGGIVQINPGEAAKGVGEALSTVGLEELKRRIDSLLAESGKRIVILVDDIDRLDRDETHSIFKLVKLSASFKYTCYVLAFDDDVVSAALGERYGAGGQEAGRAFLEKIIQVPLHLPPADSTSLRTLAFEGVDSALKQAEISLEQPRVDAFVRHFVDGLEPKLETPRLAKLYTNALSFALPLLKGEVDIVDLMLIEGIRVFYPRLYSGIRDNPDIFLRGAQENRRHDLPTPASPINDLLEKSLPGTTKDQRDRIKDRLLKPLFPRVGNTGYGGEWDKIWATGQKICSAQYFQRFFTYGIPEGDVSDSQINSLIAGLGLTDDAGQRELLQGFSSGRAMPRLIAVLRDRADSIEQSNAISLAKAVARNADLLPRERGPMILGGTMMQGGILISQLIKCIATAERQNIAEEIIELANPLGFGMECLRWIQHSPDQPEELRLLTDDGELRLKTTLIQRISSANEISPLYIQYPKDATSLYWLWKSSGNAAQVTAALETRFIEQPEEVDVFLDCFVGEGWEMESGLPVRSKLDRRDYDSITNLVPAESIMANLTQRYGTELDTPQYYPDDRLPIEIKFAHQFAYIHKEVMPHSTVEQTSQPTSN